MASVSTQTSITQSTSLTPQLQEAIQLLQLSNLEVTQLVEQKIMENPFLEINSPSDESFLDEYVTHKELEWEGQENIWHTESSYQERDSYSSHAIRIKNAFNQDDEESNFLDSLAEPPTLRAHLFHQVATVLHTAIEKKIGDYLVDALDEDGYLRVSLEEIAQDIDQPISIVEDVLFKVQQLDPPGIFARSLKECLKIQLMERNQLTPTMDKILDYLEYYQNYDLKKLSKACGIREDICQKLLKQLSVLNPKPASGFDRCLSSLKIPDVILTIKENGTWKVELNPCAFPDLVVEGSYYMDLKQNIRRKDELSHLNRFYSDAKFLVKALTQRAQTILKVAHEIVLKQNDFFLFGSLSLKPMQLKEIAEALGMHESTISRVTTQKYIQTPVGIFELKYFFGHSLSSSNMQSYKAIQEIIKSLIDHENPLTPLSDQELVTLLSQRNINIARRTVAKYREELKIPSSSIRKRLCQMKSC